ncbi:GbsR/MarR family transcriptional regulator [Micromonospora sp. NBC_01796]|uniref:GbsR/MarR family transcriptional regulator n=1 Tax=Micromonospora sp. NBC_01796 TaxID=2975987 RepID=UPI002DDA087D|nr:MarR family transcriptional regulator [Micromonospora sp. NBC_01796]WSA86619.1 MarR family transcriptional regulator [Micromonospora sp. NBC_01796]
MQPDGRRDEEAVRRFIEHFALTLSDMGMPRMAARVFAALMAAEEPGLTASEISERLGVSPAAVSGAVRYLMQVGMAVREPAPGSRRDLYKAPSSSWYSSTVRGGVYQRVADVVQEGVLAVGDESSLPGGRLADMRDFFHYVQGEMGVLVERWEQARREARTGS